MDFSKKDNRLSFQQKVSNDYAWFKDRAKKLEVGHSSLYSLEAGGGSSKYRRMKVNYDLFNNKINLEDFSHVCNPFDDDTLSMPARMDNKDIASKKIKVILGMEMKRPFSYSVVATNSEATSAREKEEFRLIKEFVIAEIMKPVREELEMAQAEQTKGQKLSPEEQKQIQAQIEQELKAKTPQEVKKYMERDYQHPSEVLSQQLLEYLIPNLDLRKKFNDCFKHGMLSAKQIIHIDIVNDEPFVEVINPLRFHQDSSYSNEYIEDGESCTVEYRMAPSDVIVRFGDELSNQDIDDIYAEHSEYRKTILDDRVFDLDETAVEEDSSTIKVMHYCWKSLRQIGFLTTADPESGEINESIVGENYRLNPEAGDIDLRWEWVPEVYETWQIGKNKFVRMRPVPGQFRDLDNLYECKLPYYGISYDNMNSEETALMDRLKNYQFWYNIINFRIENLLATDKGKKILMNIGAVPGSMSLKTWQHYAETSPFMWYDPKEEGSDAYDANTVAKALDLSLASDIQKYMQLADYIELQAGKSVGITESTEGQTSPSETVGNNRQNLVQSSHILEPYFNLHNAFKRNVLQGLLNISKVAYSHSTKKKLIYVLDDLSRKMLDLDINLLENNTLGIFVANSAKAEEAKDMIRQLAHAAMQNQAIEMSDVISIIRQEGIVEAEENLKVAEKDKKEFVQRMEQQKGEEARKLKELDIQAMKEKHEREKELIVIKEEERRKTEFLKGQLMAASFNPDQDQDNDGINDFLELSRHNLDVEVEKEKLSLEKDKLKHQKEIDKEKIKIEKNKTKR